jgi:hypothetical protein
MKYFPAIGSVIGTSANVEYVFFIKPDGSIKGQGYWFPALSLALPSRERSAVSGTLGFTYGCNGEPDNYRGYFASLTLSGYGSNFGVDGEALFGRLFQSMSTESQNPTDFRAAKAIYFRGANGIANAVIHVEKLQKRQGSDAFDFSLSKFSTFYNKAHTYTFNSRDVNEVKNLRELVDQVLMKERRSQEEFRLAGILPVNDLATQIRMTVHELKRPILITQLMNMQVIMEWEAYRLAQILFPINVYSRYTDLQSGRKIDMLKKHLKVIRKEHGSGIEAWLKAIISGYEQKISGNRSLRHIVNNWQADLRIKGSADFNQSVGGVRGKQNIMSGCNSVAMSPDALASYVSMLGTPVRATQKMLAVRNVLGVTKVGSSSVTDLTSRIKERAGRFVQESNISLAHYYRLYGTDIEMKSGSSGIATSIIRDFFEYSCGDP